MKPAGYDDPGSILLVKDKSLLKTPRDKPLKGPLTFRSPIKAPNEGRRGKHGEDVGQDGVRDREGGVLSVQLATLPELLFVVF